MTRFALILIAALALSAAPALAGPPLICHTADIGDAQSLPWLTTSGWDGSDPSYDVSHLTPDVLALLSAQTPVDVRTETLRRAAIYAARDVGLANILTARLLDRARAADLSGRPDPTALFDAGYFIETVREAALLYERNMLRPEQRAGWQLRGDTHLDGIALIRKAVAMGESSFQPALSAVEQARISY